MSSDYKKTQNIFPHPMCEDLKKLNVEKAVKIKQDAYDRYKKR